MFYIAWVFVALLRTFPCVPLASRPIGGSVGGVLVCMDFAIVTLGIVLGLRVAKAPAGDVVRSCEVKCGLTSVLVLAPALELPWAHMGLFHI